MPSHLIVMFFFTGTSPEAALFAPRVLDVFVVTVETSAHPRRRPGARLFASECAHGLDRGEERDARPEEDRQRSGRTGCCHTRTLPSLNPGLPALPSGLHSILRSIQSFAVRFLTSWPVPWLSASQFAALRPHARSSASGRRRRHRRRRHHHQSAASLPGSITQRQSDRYFIPTISEELQSLFLQVE